MDLFKPRGASSPRRPTDNNQHNGQIYNTPRFSQLGGLTGASKASHKEGGKSGIALEKSITGRKVI
jgi:hypothetical protein